MSETTEKKNLFDMAHRLAELGDSAEAKKAYSMALEVGDLTPEQRLEAASFILFSGGDYRISYVVFVQLYQEGFFRRDILNIMQQAFYDPNVEVQVQRYEENCRRLADYPYLFRKDFLPPEQLPIRFFPHDDHSYLPFDVRTAEFRDYFEPGHEKIDRYFFKDLENPILADDVYSQYHLEYLYDNVRKSEWVAKDNHIYLHYTSWEEFCSYLTVLDVSRILEDEKIVFLIEEEIHQYPIDFKERYGIDYSQYTVKPFGIREFQRLIWHTQFSTHNGGDFFNEVLYDHPNIVTIESIMMDKLQENVKEFRTRLRNHVAITSAEVAELYAIGTPTEKDLIVASFLNQLRQFGVRLDPTQRISPALMLQPHFSNMIFDWNIKGRRNYTRMMSKQLDEINNSPFFQQFKYIKTFTPMRRPTTSYAATVRFMVFSKERDDYRKMLGRKKGDMRGGIPDVLMQRIANQSYQIDWQNRLYKDCVLVRFEDGKLNPKATFTALAEFLDVPYTHSMTYCSSFRGINQVTAPGNALAFDPSTVYRTYDEYAGHPEREILEYFLRDAYEFYGYDFMYYKGEPVDDAWLEDKASHCDVQDSWLRKYPAVQISYRGNPKDEEAKKKFDEFCKRQIDRYMWAIEDSRKKNLKKLRRELRFVNENGQRLQYMPLLQLDPNLLEQPLYRKHDLPPQFLEEIAPEVLETKEITQDIEITKEAEPAGENAVEQNALESIQLPSYSEPDSVMEKGTVYFFTGLSGAGKTTLGGLFYRRLKARKPNVVVLDGDQIRPVFCEDRGYSDEDRRYLAQRSFRVCKMLSDQGIDVVLCAIAMYDFIRDWARDNIENYQEIYIAVSKETLLQRNQKGLYTNGTNVVGVDLPFEEPKCPDIIVQNDGSNTPLELVEYIESVVFADETTLEVEETV